MIQPDSGSEFVKAYHFTTAEHAISSIGLRRLKVARFSEVNDPFELMGLDCMNRPRRRALEAFRNLQNEKTGLLCFSAGWKTPVLWSHYAAGGRGMCLGFEIRKTFGIDGVHEVKYSNAKLKALGDEPIPTDLEKLLFVTKFEHWNYEEELRAFVDLKTAVRQQELFFYTFGDDLRLRDVILGPLCVENVESVRTLVRATNPGARVSRSRLGFKYFEVKEHERYPAK